MLSSGRKIDLAEAVALLTVSPLLRGVHPDELRTLAETGRQLRRSPGQIIYAKHDEGHEILFLVSGRIKIVSSAPSGSNMILSFIERGEFFGELAMLDGGNRHHDAVVADHSEVLGISRRDFVGVMRRWPEVPIRMSVMLSQRIRQLANLAEDAVLFDAPTRLLHRLKSLAENYGVTSPDGAGVIIRHSLSQQEIADSIGLTRVSVNRHLRKWNLEGLIEYGRGFIRIPDIHRLESRIQKPDYSA